MSPVSLHCRFKGDCEQSDFERLYAPSPHSNRCSYIQSLDKSLEQIHLVAMVMDEDTE